MPFFVTTDDATTLSQPSYAWLEDSNTGIYYLNNKSFGLATDGGIRLSFNGGRQVALGTSDYKETFTVGGKIFSSNQYVVDASTNSSPMFSFRSSSNSGMYMNNSNALSWCVNGSELMTINEANLQINTGFVNNGQYLGKTSSQSNPAYSFVGSSNTGLYLDVSCNMGFSVAGVEGMSICPTNIYLPGKVSIGTSNTNYMLSVIGNSHFQEKIWLYNGTCNGGIGMMIPDGTSNTGIYYGRSGTSSNFSGIGTLSNYGSTMSSGIHFVSESYVFENSSNLGVCGLKSTGLAGLALPYGKVSIGLSSNSEYALDVRGGPNGCRLGGRVTVGTSTSTSNIGVGFGKDSNTQFAIYSADNRFSNSDWSGTSSACVAGSNILSAIRFRYPTGSNTGIIFENTTGTPLMCMNDQYVLIPSNSMGLGVKPQYKLHLSGGNSMFEGVAYFASNVGIGTSNPLYPLDIAGNCMSSGTFISTSDSNLKYNIKKLQNSIEKVKAINGYSFYMKNDSTCKKQIGVLAQEVLPIIPEVVDQDIDGFYTVSYGNLAGVFIESIKTILLAYEQRCVEIKTMSMQLDNALAMYG